ncbi:hypothetical protein N9M21_06010 [Alphaproteobacteria bacterium]|jgi:hypothetical protein|nr:hypothetical protein [Alphaproteobacteria bacterium]
MFKSFTGVLVGALLLCGAFSRSAQAQARDLELLEVYELAASIVSRQNPLFLFPGLQADQVSVNGNGGEYHIVINGLGLPGSMATVPEPVTLRLPQSISDGDLIDVMMEGMPTSTIMPSGQSLKLINPQFQGRWSIKNRGFDSFDLSVDRIRFQGAGISYTVRKLTASLSSGPERQVLSLKVGGFDADYGDSFTGTERAKGLAVELSVPTRAMSGQVLLALAYRLSGLLLNETEVQERLAPEPPLVSSLNGLQIKFEFDGESWEQIVPPSKGKLGPLSLTAAVQDGDGPGDSRVTLSASLRSMQQTLEQMEVTVSRPSTFEVVLNGINAQALADVLLDRREGFDAPDLGGPVAFSATVDIGGFDVTVPQIDLDFGAKMLAGRVQSAPQDDGQQSFELRARADDLQVSNWQDKAQLEPFASTVITPALPKEAALGISVEGLKSEDVQNLLSAALAIDLRGVVKALPDDLGALELVLSDSFYRSRLIEAEWSGRLKPRAGRVPVQGTFDLVTGPLAPLQIGMQQSIGTPVPAISQAMSGGILGLTLLQTFAVREEGGKLRFEMEFPEAGGLPLVNGRPLPFQQFIR